MPLAGGIGSQTLVLTGWANTYFPLIPNPYTPTPYAFLDKTPRSKPSKTRLFLPPSWTAHARNPIPQLTNPRHDKPQPVTPQPHPQTPTTTNQPPPITESKNRHPTKNSLFTVALTPCIPTTYQNRSPIVSHPPPRLPIHHPRSIYVTPDPKTPYNNPPIPNSGRFLRGGQLLPRNQQLPTTQPNVQPAPHRRQAPQCPQTKTRNLLWHIALRNMLCLAYQASIRATNTLPLE